MSLRYRRNINCLTNDQLHDLREGYQTLYDRPESNGESFATIAGIHGLPNPSWCDHGTPGFLTWHRAYMKAFEKALQCVNSSIMLPFWDWSSGPTTGVPSACANPTYVNRKGDTVPNPLYSGPIATAAGGGMTARRPDIATTTFGDIATSAQSAMSSSTYNAFQNAINGPHGSVHVRVGGEMGSVPRAGFDPIFFLHHCNVDRLWWNWQQTHPGVGLPASEASNELAPFNKPFSTDWLTGGEMESTDALGYRYLNWCFILPPIRIWELVAIKFDDPWMVRSLREARLVIHASQMAMDSVEFRVFLNPSQESSRTKGGPAGAFAGSIATFGMGKMSMESRSTSRSFDLELNLTEAVRTNLAEHQEELTLKIEARNSNGQPIDAERLEIYGIEFILE